MGVSYAEIEYIQPVIHERKTKSSHIKLEGIHFILIYILALFILVSSS